MENSRNLLLAFVLSALLLVGWEFGMGYFYPQPDKPAQAAANVPGGKATPVSRPDTGDVAGTSVVAGDLDSGTPKGGPIDLDAALADPQRIVIDAPRIAGSINLVGARIDDVVLKDHRETTAKDSGPVRLFAPEGTPNPYFAEFGFVAGAKRLPSTTVWTAQGKRLTPQTPVTLTHTDADGVTYAITFSVDENYMIAAEQTVRNGSGSAAIVQPFALVSRSNANATRDEWLAHSGPAGVFGGVLDDSVSYDCANSFFLFPCTGLVEQAKVNPAGEAAWLGFTDVYWLSALIPGENEGEGEGGGGGATTGFRHTDAGLFRSDVLYEPVTVPAAGTASQSTRLFAGAKESALLGEYEDAGVIQFGKAISWGWFEIIEKPLLWLLRTLNGAIGNFGVAIIGMTLVIRGLLFPIAQRQFASMAQMKAVQPKMKALQDRYKDDKQKQQQEIMKLYKDEKVNPLAGCLPLVIQIPIFFALYKVLILSIEMRHEPFLYIKDLTAPDPATILNAFGLLPYDVPGFLGIGVLAVLLGVTMWLTFKLNPAAMDPMQQQIFNLMPWFLMFVMAPFAAGLLIYWVTSNILTLAQQKYLYSKHPQLRAAADKEKADMAKKAEREKAEKGSA